MKKLKIKLNKDVTFLNKYRFYKGEVYEAVKYGNYYTVCDNGMRFNFTCLTVVEV